jgi:hypothetical protein
MTGKKKSIFKRVYIRGSWFNTLLMKRVYSEWMCPFWLLLFVPLGMLMILVSWCFHAYKGFRETGSWMNMGTVKVVMYIGLATLLYFYSPIHVQFT